MGRVTRILVGAYRPWAQRMFFDAKTELDGWARSVAPTPERLRLWFSREPYDVVLLVGWSWIVPPEIYRAVPTIVVHPSPLPKYRGGSPLQHQIIAGEDESALTFFRVIDGPADSGPIYAQEPFSLDGSLDAIFARIEHLGARLLPGVLAGVRDGRLAPTPQDEAQATTYKRRTPEQSELTPAMLASMTARQLRDFVRALAHEDYPRAFIRAADGEPVEIWDAQ